MSLWHLIGLIVVAFLVMFLCRRHEGSICSLDKRMSFGQGMDIPPVAERIRQVREDYLAVINVKPRGRGSHERLHAAARCSLKRLAYFQNVGSAGDEESPREAEAHPG